MQTKTDLDCTPKSTTCFGECAYVCVKRRGCVFRCYSETVFEFTSLVHTCSLHEQVPDWEKMKKQNPDSDVYCL